MDSLEDVERFDRALVFGVGGSGDVVGGIPTARYLQSRGVDVDLGGLAWEPVPHDMKPGPRPFDEIRGLTPISAFVGWADESTRTDDGDRFTETTVAEYYHQPTVLLDITGGHKGLRRGLVQACENRGWDLVVGVDSGGDVLARGDEPGLRSPVADALCLAVLRDLPVPTFLGVFGYGSDGELTLPELEERMGALYRADALLGAWGLTPRIRREMEQLLEKVPTEASRLPVEAAAGILGDRTIRNGKVRLRMTPPAPVSFYFRTEPVADQSLGVDLLADCENFEEVLEAFGEAEITTEFDRELERLPDEPG